MIQFLTASFKIQNFDRGEIKTDWEKVKSWMGTGRE